MIRSLFVRVVDIRFHLGQPDSIWDNLIPSGTTCQLLYRLKLNGGSAPIALNHNR